ncbi:MAG: hypothetical protein ACPGQS_05065 [Bradymonadia bacterium]
MAMAEIKAIDAFRRQFFKERINRVRKHGILILDEACLLMHDERAEKDVVVTDTFSNDRAHGAISHFIAGIAQSWWGPRQGGAEDTTSSRPLFGFYAHFLPQVSFDLVFEFRAPDLAPVMVWRIDARGNADALPIPNDDGEFRDQTGTFLDLRFGWSWLAQTYASERSMVAAEVETGYVIGLRPAATDGSEHPLERADPEVDELVDRYGRTRFDCVEILNLPDVAEMPFASEVFCDSLLARFLPGIPVEIFVLASSEHFINIIEEYADQAGVVVDVRHAQSEAKLVLSKGDITQTIDFSYPFLRTLYTARSFPDGVKAFINPVIEQVSGAHDIHLRMVATLPEHIISIDEFGVATVEGQDGELVSRSNLFRLSGQLWTGSDSSNAALLNVLGIDPDTKSRRMDTGSLTACSVCGAPSRVSKNIRPRYSIGDETQRFAGLATERHLIYYVQECDLHTVPLALEPNVGFGELEAAYQSGLVHAKTLLLDVQESPDEGTWTFIGHDVASAVLEPGRINGLLSHFSITIDTIWALAFYPDVLVISSEKPDGPTLERLRHRSREAVHALFPDRLWLIDMVRSIDAHTPALGTVEVAS